jgi:hypothetical protein
MFQPVLAAKHVKYDCPAAAIRNGKCRKSVIGHLPLLPNRCWHAAAKVPDACFVGHEHVGFMSKVKSFDVGKRTEKVSSCFCLAAVIFVIFTSSFTASELVIIC